MKSRGQPVLVWIKGGGDLATGVAHRLHRAGLHVVITELPQPLVVRRAVAFASAVCAGRIVLEGVEARLAADQAEAQGLLAQRIVPVLVDPRGAIIRNLHPDVTVDARMAKRNLDTARNEASVVIGLGPGFVAGEDVHAVIETARGHDLGRVILHGGATPDTHIPGLVQGYGPERLLRAPCVGVFHGHRRIGDLVQSGEIIADVDGRPVIASLSGVVRGLLTDGLPVQQGLKIGDIDPRGLVEQCFTISDKARAVGGGVLEAVLYLGRKWWSASHHLTTSAT